MTNIFRAFFGISLSLQMVIATLLAIFTGLFLGEYCHVFASWGDAYIMILKITTIPYLICALIHGIGKLSSAMAKSILQKGIFFIGCTWTINILVIYFVLSLFPTSAGIPFSSYSTIAPSQLNFAELLIPDNVFHALSHNVVPAVVVFGLIVGIAMMHIKDKGPMMAILETLVDAFTRITGGIARITPIGTFLIVAYQVGTIELSTVKQLSTYLILYITGTSLVVFWIFPKVLNLLTGIAARRWIKELFPILLLAYTTNVVIVTLPFIIELIKKEVASFYHQDSKIRDQIQGIVSIIFNLPLGSFFITIFIFFIACFYHIPLTGGNQIQLFLTTFLTSLGAVGLGSAINSLNFILDTLGLPLDAIDLYLTTLPFTAGFQATVSVMEITTLSFLIALGCHNLIKWKWSILVKGVCFIVLPLLILGGIFRVFNPFPIISNPYVSISNIQLNPPIKTVIYRPGSELPPPRSGETLQRVLQSGILRVGYNPHVVPFCFENNFKNLAGYDVAFAYALAKDLGCSLEFVPLSFENLAEEIKAGLYDIGMSDVSITEERLRKIAFTDPYIDSRIVFVMRKKFSQEISSIDDILSSPEIKVSVLKGTSYETIARSLFPLERIIPVKDYDEFAKKYPNNVLILGELQAIAWSLGYPNFTVVIPSKPVGQETLAYAISQDAERFLAFLNVWLKLKKNDQFTKHQYNLWILGKTDSVTPKEPRWSLIQNVFHWAP